MKIVIDIPKDRYKEILQGDYIPDGNFRRNMIEAVRNGTPLPKGHGRLKDVDKFLEKVKKDREHEVYMRSWTADMVLERLDSWHAPTIIEADKAESEGEQNV